MVAGTLVPEVGLLGAGGAGSGLFAGFCGRGGSGGMVMCEPGLAHSERWLCCAVGAWLVCWVVFLTRGVGGRYVRVVAVTLGVLVGWMDLGLACLLGFLARLALLWRLCVSGGYHIARGFQSRVTLCEWWLTHCGRHGCRHGVPAVTLPLRLRRCARYEIRGGT